MKRVYILVEGPTEHIDNARPTSPSHRIRHLHPTYQKPIEGSLAAMEIGLPRMRAECGRFDHWMRWLGS